MDQNGVALIYVNVRVRAEPLQQKIRVFSRGPNNNRLDFVLGQLAQILVAMLDPPLSALFALNIIMGSPWFPLTFTLFK